MLASLSEKVDQLEKTTEDKLGEVDERQGKLHREVVDARHGVNFVMVRTYMYSTCRCMYCVLLLYILYLYMYVMCLRNPSGYCVFTLFVVCFVFAE